MQFASCGSIANAVKCQGSNVISRRIFAERERERGRWRETQFFLMRQSWAGLDAGRFIIHFGKSTEHFTNAGRMPQLHQAGLIKCGRRNMRAVYIRAKSRENCTACDNPQRQMFSLLPRGSSFACPITVSHCSRFVTITPCQILRIIPLFPAIPGYI